MTGAPSKWGATCICGHPELIHHGGWCHSFACNPKHDRGYATGELSKCRQFVKADDIEAMEVVA